MGMWVGRVSGAAIVGFVAYGGYIYVDRGYLTRPELPPGATSFAFRSGLRAIAVDFRVDREARQYLGIPSEVPQWAKDEWSWCRPPSEAEAAATPPRSDLGDQSQLEAICKVERDGEVVTRGTIYSLPKP
ncbi:MAG: hypothetical protein AAF458_23780 [Pseudomonadota bacterium]